MEPHGVRTDELIRRLAERYKIDLAPTESKFAWLLVSACVPSVERDFESETDDLASQIRQCSALDPSHRSASCILVGEAMLYDVEDQITPRSCLIEIFELRQRINVGHGSALDGRRTVGRGGGRQG